MSTLFPEVNSSVTRISHLCTKDTSPEQSLSGRRAVSRARRAVHRSSLSHSSRSSSRSSLSTCPSGPPPPGAQRGERLPLPAQETVESKPCRWPLRREGGSTPASLPCPGPGGPLSPGHRKLGCSENALPSTASASGCAWTSHASSTANSLRPHGLQQARLLCPQLSPRVCSNSHILTLLSL